jgi:hypothetical protein
MGAEVGQAYEEGPIDVTGGGLDITLYPMTG